jgi:Ca-activated chloride channel family protein
MEIKVSNFANKIASPVLSDVKLRIDGAELHDLHPQMPGDVFAGTQLSVLGRFDKPGKHQLVLEGTVNGEKRAFEYSVEFKANDTSKVYLPRMWAVRRVGYLMDQINLKGANKELEAEIVRLGTKFGIVTPYTSFLVVEDTAPVRPGRPLPEGRRADDSAFGSRGSRTGLGGGVGGRSAPAAPQDQSGGDAVARSKANADRRDAESAGEAEQVEKKAQDDVEGRARKSGESARRDQRVEALKEKGMSDEQAKEEAANVVKTIGTRSFIWSDGVWMESDLKNGEIADSTAVEYMSEQWFELSRKGGDAAKILALGSEVVFRINGKTIRIAEPKEEEKEE